MGEAGRCAAGLGAPGTACHSCWSHSPRARPSAARPAPPRPPHTAGGSPAPRPPRSTSAARRAAPPRRPARAPPSTAPAAGRGWRGSSALLTRYHLQREEEKLVTGASLLELCSGSGYSSSSCYHTQTITGLLVLSRPTTGLGLGWARAPRRGRSILIIIYFLVCNK